MQHVTFQGNTGSGAAIQIAGNNPVKVYNSLLLDSCSGNFESVGSLSNDHTCVDETSDSHTSVAADSDL